VFSYGYFDEIEEQVRNDTSSQPRLVSVLDLLRTPAP